VRAVPQITAADGVDNTFFGYDPDLNGKPNFFGTSAPRPNAAAVARARAAGRGRPGSMAPADVYSVMQTTAHQIPLANVRYKSNATAGPVKFDIHGDWTRWSNYYELSLDKNATGTSPRSCWTAPAPTASSSARRSPASTGRVPRRGEVGHHRD
jgi:hypothetical protein